MNRVVHFEIHAKDFDLLQKFYQDVFGWKIENMGPQMMNYRMVTTGSDEPGATLPGINGGIVQRVGVVPKGGDPVNAYICTIEVENIDKTISSILAAGGSVVLSKMDVPGIGMLGYCKDPEGNIFGILQPEEKGGFV